MVILISCTKLTYLRQQKPQQCLSTTGRHRPSQYHQLSVSLYLIQTVSLIAGQEFVFTSKRSLCDLIIVLHFDHDGQPI